MIAKLARLLLQFASKGATHMFVKRFKSQSEAMIAVNAAVAAGRCQSGHTHSPNGCVWFAHVRRGATSFCL